MFIHGLKRVFIIITILSGCADTTVDDNGKPLMKKIDNRYYFIINDTDSNEEDIEWSEMYSVNAIVAVYDVDNNILYYYEIDT